jgi:DNA-binding response OmpR family regulator
MKILIIEDDSDLVTFLKQNLSSEGFLVDYSKDGEKGESMACYNEYDLIILDLNVPSKNGKEICKTVRDNKKMMPILVLTADFNVQDKIDLLNLGADDYLTKPFSFEELTARIKALLRRPKDINADETLQISNLSLNKNSKKVLKDDKEVYLTLKEFSLLEYLMENKGKIISRGMIIDHVWDMKGDIFSNTIESHIFNLRKKLDNKKLIKTIPGRGYRID